MNPLGLNNRLPWRTAFKIAWREAHASSAKFLFVIAAVAIGVGSLAGVRGFSSAFYGMLLREARTLPVIDGRSGGGETSVISSSWFDDRRGRRQQLTTALELDLAAAIAQQAVVPDALEARRQHVQQEAPHELVDGQPHDLGS